MKKTVSILLTLLMVLTLCAGCAAPQTAEPTDSAAPASTPQAADAPQETAAYTPGTYTISTSGRNGPMEVQVTFDEQSILSIEVPTHMETLGVADAALTLLPQRIIENQSLAVDTLSTATVTSLCLINAVAQAVDEAGGDSAALRDKTIEKTPQAPQELTADVVILGGGGAGLSAAVSASEAGASVILVEKTAMLGGNTMRSGGFFNAVVEGRQESLEMTSQKLETVRSYIDMEPKNEIMANWQKELQADLDEYEASGVAYLFDSIYLHMLQTYSDGDFYGNPTLIEYFCTEAPNTYRWLEERGYPWGDAPRIITGSLWQRTNFSSTYKAGYGYFKVLEDYIAQKSLPVQILYEVTAESLLTDNGAVTGATATGNDGTQYTLNAGKGVIVATGGFSANVEMREKYNEQWPEIGAGVITSNTPAITGDGIRMAEAVGADLVDMGLIQFFPVADPWTGETNTGVGIMTNPYINKEGKRYVDETSRRDVLTKANLSQTDGLIYIVSSQANSLITPEGKNNYGYDVEQMIAAGKVFKADTLPELAELIGVPADALVETIAKYNEGVDKGKDEEFGRTIFDAAGKLEEGPFYATPRKPAVHHTMGGIQVNTSAQVISTDGSVIPGLYAAGETTGGFHGGNRLGGNAIAEAITTGRVAGAAAAAN